VTPIADVSIDDLLRDFPRERTWLLPALHAAQERLGHLPDGALAQVAAHLRVPVSDVWGVATGYPEFRLAPCGRHHVRVCTGVSCALLGGSRLLEAVATRYTVKPGEMGPGRELTVESADCFFECSMAPMIEVDGEYRGRVTERDVPALDRWFRGAAPRSHSASEPVLPRAAAPAASAGAVLDALVADAEARRTRRPARSLLVQMGTCGRAVGAEAVLEAIRREARARGTDARIVAGACNGMCYAAPSVEIAGAGWPRAVLERVTPDMASPLLDRLAGDEPLDVPGVAWSDAPWRGLRPAAQHPFWAGQERVLLARTGVIDPEDLDDALAHGAYRALARALDESPEWVIDAVKSSGLLGRGGAFFPTATKWEACRTAAGAPKYVVVNGEEGEPGIFKDRHLMEGDPHQLLEGLLLAAYASGASHAFLYVHGEATLSASRLARAVAQAEAAGIVGASVLGRAFACRVELRRGAGGFVLGEETALLESIEGRRAQPRTRPPFPVESGLWGRPTVINNVETLSAIPSIVGRGGAWFAGLGTAQAPGTKVFGLSGPIARPGVVEVRNGVTLTALLDIIGGGLANGGAFRGAVVGGPSGSIVPAALFGIPMEPRGQVSPGTGGIAAVPEGASVVEIVKTLLAFNARESCGKCTPCREGTPRLSAMIDELSRAGGDLDRVRRVTELAQAIQLASLCGLGQAAPLALTRALETFPDEFSGAGQ